ncbi:hypothetical protein [Streptomyces sp. NPDC059943]|uniref:hypothetical protein n=1 Tax=Streptomyces sp. NPDC059943 TaxID=3347010 RepID=UPI003663C0F3
MGAVEGLAGEELAVDPTELDDAERAAFGHGVTVRRGHGYTLRVTASPAGAEEVGDLARHVEGDGQDVVEVRVMAGVLSESMPSRRAISVQAA